MSGMHVRATLPQPPLRANAIITKPSDETPIVKRLKGSIPCLSLIYRVDKGHKVLVASGCLISERGKLFWLTAGHVIHDIEKLRDNGVVVAVRWQDGQHPALPAEIHGWARVYVDENGIDFGIVELPQLHADNMRANSHFKAFTLNECVELGSAEADRIAQSTERKSAHVLGYPQDWATIHVQPYSPGLAKAEVAIRPVEIPLLYAVTRKAVESAFGPTEHSFWMAPCVYARIPDRDAIVPGTDPLPSIKGVSGGPVVLDLDPGYRLLGTQTAWLPRMRGVRLLPIGFVKNCLLRYFEWLDAGGADNTSTSNTPPS
jgi:hypothetical protein